MALTQAEKDAIIADANAREAACKAEIEAGFNALRNAVNGGSTVIVLSAIGGLTGRIGAVASQIGAINLAAAFETGD